MYRFRVDSKLGDYIKANDDAIYKISGIQINIFFNEETMQDEIFLSFEGVDARDPFGQYYLIDGHMAEPATNEEVNLYVLNHLTNDEDLHQSLKTEDKDLKATDEDLKTTDDILDEFIKYQELINLIGDENGKYNEKSEVLKKKFIDMTTEHTQQHVEM